MGAVRYYSIAPGKELERVEGLEEVLRRRQSEAFVWLDYSDPSQQELTTLVAPLGLHPLAIEDCVDEDQVPKTEEFPHHTFVLFNRYRQTGSDAVVEEVDFFLGEKFLVSVHSHGVANSGFAERLETTVRHNFNLARGGPDFLLEVLLDDIVDEKFTAIEALQEQLNAAEEEILEEETLFQPSKLIRLRRSLLFLRKSLVYEREVLVKLCRRDSPFITEKAIYEFRDIYDHLAKFFEIIEICRELISNIVEIHLSMVNNQMALVANKTNRVVRGLTLITTIFMPLTMLAGIGGMSEWSMITGPQNWRIAYPAFMAAMVAIGAANYYLLRRLYAGEEK